MVAASAVHAIDLTTNKKLEDLATSPGASFDSVEVSPDGKRAVVYGRGAVAVINGSSGKPQTQLRTFKSIAGVTVEW